MVKKFNISLPEDLIEIIFREGPEIARFNMQSYLEVEIPIMLNKMFGSEYYNCNICKNHVNSCSCEEPLHA